MDVVLLEIDPFTRWMLLRRRGRIYISLLYKRKGKGLTAPGRFQREVLLDRLMPASDLYEIVASMREVQSYLNTIQSEFSAMLAEGLTEERLKKKWVPRPVSDRFKAYLDIVLHKKSPFRELLISKRLQTIIVFGRFFDFVFPPLFLFLRMI